MRGTQANTLLWRLAWVAFVLAVPTRLYYFSGYGLGDDHIFAATPLRVLQTGSLDFADFRTNRLMLLIPQVLAFLALPVNDFSFVLPILVFALGTHALCLLFVREFAGERAAFFTSLLFLTSPYESLASTTFSMDYVLTFYSTACAWSCYRGYATGSLRAMILGGVFLASCFLAKAAAILLIPVLGLAALCTLRQWRRWLAFWGAFSAAMAAVSLAFWLVADDPLQWLTQRAYPFPGGHDVTGMLAAVLSAYPRYILWTDPDHGVWMFGGTGLLGMAGLLVGAGVWFARRWLPRVLSLKWLATSVPYRASRPASAATTDADVRRKLASTSIGEEGSSIPAVGHGPARAVTADTAENTSGLLTLFLVYLLVFNFTPHKLDFTGFFSHPRIFRYLAQVAPCLYVAAAVLADMLWCCQRRAGAVAAAVLMVGTCAFGLYQMPLVTAPSRDSGQDGRALSRFFREQPPSARTTINGDAWNCQRLQQMNYPASRRWSYRCRDFLTSTEKLEFLQTIDHGYVITGGAALDWYSLHPWVLNLSELGFQPPSGWQLLMERPAPVTPWRTEPLRIWRVADALERSLRAIPDPRFEACLRQRVQPLRLEDGVAPDQPITERLARLVTTLECNDAGIQDASGLEAFVNVEVLNLAGNVLRTVDVSQLTRLRILILGINELETVDGLPNLHDLTLLWLGHNKLESVDVRGLENLRDLRVDGNRLRRLEGGGDLVQLESLFLGGNPHLDCASLGFPEALVERSGCLGARVRDVPLPQGAP